MPILVDNQDVYFILGREGDVLAVLVSLHIVLTSIITQTKERKLLSNKLCNKVIRKEMKGTWLHLTIHFYTIFISMFTSLRQAVLCTTHDWDFL